MRELVAYIAQGDIGIIRAGKASPLPSQRLKQYERTLRALEEKHAWKTEGAGAQFMGKHNPYAGMSEQTGLVTALAAYDGDLIYATVTGESGGLFRKNPEDAAAQEGLLYSGTAFEINDLHAKGGIIAASLGQRRGERHIAAFFKDKSGYSLLTEGDTSDRYPFLSPTSDEIYYSSAGYARNEQGAILGISPYGIYKLTPATGEVEDVYADPALDCLKYSETGHGERYMMVRPHAKPSSGPSLKSILLAPVWLLRAVGGFLNVFTMRYGGRTLHTDGASPAKARQKSQRELFIEGNLIEADRYLKENEQRGESYPGIVSKEWRLVRLLNNGNYETIKQGVIDYALLPSGGFVYTNGKYVIACDAAGKATVLLKDMLVTRLAVLPCGNAEASAASSCS